MPWDQTTSKHSAAIKILTATIFINSLSFAIVIPSLWFFIADLGGTKTQLGITIALYSLGQLIFSILFGKMAEKTSSKSTIYLSLVLAVIGNVMYSFANNLVLVYIGRFLVGAGAANVAVARAYVSHVTSDGDRVGVMALLSAAQGIAFIFGPMLGAAFSLLPSDWWHVYFISNGRYTFVGFFSAFICLVNVGIMVPFVEQRHNEEKNYSNGLGTVGSFTIQTKSEETGESTGLLSSSFSSSVPNSPPRMKFSNPNFPRSAFFVSLIIFFIITSDFSVFETIAVPFTHEAYGFGIKTNGYVFAGAGFLAVSAYICLGTLKKVKPNNNHKDRFILLLGLVLCLFGFASMTLWSIMFTQEAYESKSPSETHKVDNQLPLWRFLLGAAIQSIGYPFAQGMMFALFSKIMEPSSLESGMGYLTASGSLARMIGPLGSTILYDHVGAYMVFFSISCLIILGILIFLQFYSSFVPYSVFLKRRTKSMFIFSSDGKYDSEVNQNV